MLSNLEETFKQKFSAADSLEIEIFNELSNTTKTVMTTRSDAYQSDGLKVISSLQNLLKSFPQFQLATDSMNSYITAVKKSEKVLLQSCDTCAEIKAAVEADTRAFGCTDISLCPCFPVS